MDFNEVIKRQRETYLKQLTSFYSERTTGAKEVLLELNTDEEERIFKLYRLDYLENVDGQPKPTELAADTYLNYEPVSFILRQLDIELNPFYWHGCDLILASVKKDVGWLITWTEKWIDENDKNPIDINGFQGTIHSVTRPTITEKEISFSVDFGTADEDCFMDLILQIEQQGIKNIRIGSFEMIR